MKKTTRKGRSAPAPRAGGRGRPTRERILDVAEQLFAHRGFHGVSVRDITGAVGVDVALANYYFGSKGGLLEAVFHRRSEILNAERLKRLEVVLARTPRGKVPSLEDIIDAFTHPLLEFSERGGPGWKSFFALVAEINNSPEWGNVLMTRHFDPLVQKLIAAIRMALPDSDDRDLYWAYHFLSGALTLTFAETGRIDRLSNGVCHARDLDDAHARLVAYCAAGFRAVCRPAALRAPTRRRAR